MDDYLDEDPVINSQQYAILSYVLPEEVDLGDKSSDYKATPMFKIRGSFQTIEGCEARIKKLQAVDRTFNMFVVEVGKWGALLTKEQIEKNDDIEVVHREEFMNQLIRGKKEQKILADEEFERRTNEMKQKAIYEGSPEGQAELAARSANVSKIEDTPSSSSE